MSRLDFNRSPYFDDYDSSKNFLKVLYKPGFPVQARELNQTQSIIQNQVESFANHIFKSGSKVSNARTSLVAKAYVRLSPDSTAVSRFPEGTIIVGVDSGIRAVLVRGVDAEGADPVTIFVVYLTSGIDAETSEFIQGETLNFFDDNNINIGEVGELFKVRCPACPGSLINGETMNVTGQGQFFTIDEGVFYYEGMFISVLRQDIIVEKYYRDQTNGIIPVDTKCKIGLDFVQTVVDYNDDPTLLDPSLGYPNSTAPGADRYKVQLVLVKRPYDEEDGENFILLCKVSDNGRIEFVKSDSEYADLGDTLAKRTYETNGDYTVRPFKVQFLDHKKSSATDPLGWALSGNANNLVALVSPSVAYVKGYRVETSGETPLTFEKARDTAKVSSFIKNFDNRTYILATPATESFFTGLSNSIATHLDANKVTLWSGTATAGTNAGSEVGSFRVSDVAYHSGAYDLTATFKYYIYDLVMTGANQFSAARSFHYATPYAGGDVRANLVLNAVPEAEIFNSNRTSLIYRLDRDNVKSLRDLEDPVGGSISIVVRKVLSGVGNAGSGSVTFTLPVGEYFTGAATDVLVYVESGAVIDRPNYDNQVIVTVNPSSLVVAERVGYDVDGKTVTVICNVLKTAQKEKTKSIATNSITGIVLTGNGQAQIPLAYPDVFSIDSMVINSNGSPFLSAAASDYYELVTNITDQYYGISYLKKKKDLPVIPDPTLSVTYRYFQRSGSAGYYTIDSYKTVIEDVTSGITYADLPVYKDNSGNLYPIASSIDFRPDLDSVTGEFTGTFNFPANESTAIFDIESYLPRTDLLQINEDSILYIKKGEPSETPRPPRPDGDAMALYEIWMKPYVYSLKDISTKYIDNRRYTMKDIGLIDKRLQNVEYYTVLNLLEKSAADMAIKDDNGLDRFKNGFIADNFQDFQAADLQSHEFKAALDRSSRELRPKFKTKNHKFVLDEAASENFVRKGNMAFMPYVEAQFLEQPYATKHLSINPFLQYNQRGSMLLSPNNDVWSDDEELPEMTIDIDAGVEAYRQLANATGILGTDWGSWIDQNRTIIGSPETTITQSETVGNRGTTTTTSTTTTTAIETRQARGGVSTTVESKTDSYLIDDIVKDVQIIPYIREMDVQFIATKMKANTRVYAYFNGIAVSEHCRDIGFQISDDQLELKELISYGSPLITDSNGEIRGSFRIPAGKFFVGEKIFLLSDDPANSGDPDLVSTSATALYFAGGLDITRQDVSLNVITPFLKKEQLTEERSVPSTEIENTTEREFDPFPEPELPPSPVPPVFLTLPPPDPCTCCESCKTFICELQAYVKCMCSCAPNSPSCKDPVAQAFTVEYSSFITSLDIYFRQVDLNSDRIFVELRNTINGYPGNIVLSKKEFTSNDLLSYTSEDSTVAFPVNFDCPVYVEANTMYCFVVGGSSPNTRIWLAKTGEKVVNMPDKIVERQVTADPSFRSLNGTTWNAEQTEQIKYRLRRAVFSTFDMTLRFVNEDVGPVNISADPFQFEAGNLRFRVHHPDHGFTQNDNVQLSVYEKTQFQVSTNAANQVPQVGHIITVDGSPGTRGRVWEVTPHATANNYLLKMVDVVGNFNPGATWTAVATTVAIRDVYLSEALGSVKPASYNLNSCAGTIVTGLKSAKYPTGLINGVDSDVFNKQFQILEVDSPDSYVLTLQAGQVPAVTGRFGDVGVMVFGNNEKYEVFNISGAYLPYRCSERWSYEGIGHGDTGSLFQTANYARQPEIVFNLGENRYLKQPFKISSGLNNSLINDSGKSAHLNAYFTTSSALLSPVINLDTFSLTTVSNRVGWRTFAGVTNADNAAAIVTAENTVTNVSFDPSDTTNKVWLSERNSTGGTEPYTYVTRTVTLADGANDLMIFVDCYKDMNADFDVYIKLQRSYDTGKIDDKLWTHLDNVTKLRSSVDLTDFIEYELKASENIGNWSLAADPFISFKVKLVGRTTNSAKPPLFKSLRCIAVT